MNKIIIKLFYVITIFVGKVSSAEH